MITTIESEFWRNVYITALRSGLVFPKVAADQAIQHYREMLHEEGHNTNPTQTTARSRYTEEGPNRG